MHDITCYHYGTHDSRRRQHLLTAYELFQQQGAAYHMQLIEKALMTVSLFDLSPLVMNKLLPRFSTEYKLLFDYLDGYRAKVTITEAIAQDDKRFHISAASKKRLSLFNSTLEMNPRDPSVDLNKSTRNLGEDNYHRLAGKSSNKNENTSDDKIRDSGNNNNMKISDSSRKNNSISNDKIQNSSNSSNNSN